jgi:DNA (cytosine-5)-methyltransferase 1
MQNNSTSKPKLLDLFCGAGGAGMGYHRAGFEVVGVDNQPMPRYPFEFHQADAFEYLAEHYQEFDVIHASPPCQFYARITRLTGKTENHQDLIEPTRSLLRKTGKPYIIENIPDAPLLNPITLCGTMFGLRVFRHRKFETSFDCSFAPAMCNHWAKSDSLGFSRSKVNAFITVVGHFAGIKKARLAMGIDWMIRDELSQAIPPAYTEWIGLQILKVTRGTHG